MTVTQIRKGWIGLARETTAGVPVTPANYVPFVEESLVEKIAPIADVAAYGTREGQRTSTPGKKWGEGTFSINLDANLIGHLFYGIMGTYDGGATVSGSVKDHTFSRNNSNAPQTYSLTLDRSTDRLIFPYTVLSALEISFADDAATAKASVFSRFPVTTASGTLTTASGILFTWKDASLQLGATLSAAGSASQTKVEEFTITIENNAKPSWRSGSQEPASIDVANFRVHGSFKLYFEDTTELANYKNQTKQAAILKFTGRGIGGQLYETITLNLPRIRYDEAMVETPLDDFIMLNCTFEAEYDTTTSKMLDIVLRNTTSTYS